jgi:hypothetical protein
MRRRSGAGSVATLKAADADAIAGPVTCSYRARNAWLPYWIVKA